MRDVDIEFLQFGDDSVGDVLLVLRVVRIAVLDAARDHGHGSARMRNDDLDVRILVQHAVGQEAGASAGDIEVKFVHRGGDAVVQIRTARRRQRVHVDDRAAPVELLPHRIEVRIAGPAGLIVIGVNPDAVGLQRVEPVLDLFHNPIDIGQGHACEQPETLGMLGHQLGPVVVAGTHGGAALLRVVVQNVAHLRHRQDRDGDIELIHLLERRVRRPWATASRAASSPSAGSASAAYSSKSADTRRDVMMVHVNTAALGGRFFDELPE